MAFYGIIKIVIMSLYNLIYICAGILTQRTGVVNLVLFPMCRPVASGSAPARRRRDKAPEHIHSCAQNSIPGQGMLKCATNRIYRNLCWAQNSIPIWKNDLITGDNIGSPKSRVLLMLA